MPTGPEICSQLNGALIIDKPRGPTSHDIVRDLQSALIKTTGLKKRDLPKIGHGGTLDPFATGVLVVCLGSGVKLVRYFLGSNKTYEGTIHFGKSTASGDLTDPIQATSEVLPAHLSQIQDAATRFTQGEYLQIPPMHSAKKQDGKPLYELARQGIVVERQAKSCRLSQFDILNYDPPRAQFRVECSAGTYIRTLAQDLAHRLGSLAHLESLDRVASGTFLKSKSLPLDQVLTAPPSQWTSLLGWIDFDDLLRLPSAIQATRQEAQDLIHGKQAAFASLLTRALDQMGSGQMRLETELETVLPIYYEQHLVAVGKLGPSSWQLERVFPLALDSR